jgi:hypothetical protein
VVWLFHGLECFKLSIEVLLIKTVLPEAKETKTSKAVQAKKPVASAKKAASVKSKPEAEKAQGRQFLNFV